MSNSVLDRLHLGTPAVGPPSASTWINVRDYGALGDGVTDDGGAIALAYAAIVAQGGGTLFFPGPSTYRTTLRVDITTSHVTVEGNGSTILFDPSNAVTNDRWLAVTSGASGISSRRSITGAIAIGATSFVAAAAASVTDLVAGDWLLVTEFDGVEPFAVDWVQVASVAGTTVTPYAPFRTAFPATHGTVAFQRITNLVTNVTVRDLTLTMTATPATSMTGITVGVSRGVLIDHCALMTRNGSGMSTYLAAQLTVRDCVLQSRGLGPEFASTVDLVVQGCACGVDGIAPSGSGLIIDFGTAFFTVASNRIYNAGNIGMQVSHGVHDGVVSGNVLSWVGNAGIGLGQGIGALGAQRIAYVGNVLDGGFAGAGNTGLASDTDTASTPNILSTGNVFTGNVVTNFTHPIMVAPAAGDTYLQASAVLTAGDITTTGALSGATVASSVGSVTSTQYMIATLGMAPSGAAKSFITSPTNGKAVLQNAVFSAGIGFNFTTDGTLELVDRPLTGAGNLKVGGAFGCNAAAAQTAAASGGALAAYSAGANGLDTGAHMSALHALVVAMRAALVANGIMS